MRNKLEFNLRIILRNRDGSALLVALLVMGVFLAISLALSVLILRETRITQDVIEGGKAYYAAESGIEAALHRINTELAGWEPANSFQELKLAENITASFRVKNRCQAFPCFDEEEFVRIDDNNELKAYYDVLDLNETVQIPLFIVEEDQFGVVMEKKVGGFTVEFFATFDPGRHFKIENGGSFNLSGWDVLRWKVLGLNSQLNTTESIGDFTAVSYLLNQTDHTEKFATNAKQPSWFGSVSCNDGAQEQRYATEIRCAPTPAVESFKLHDPNQVSAIFAGTCTNTEAREHYVYGPLGQVDSENIFECYPIRNFLGEHKLNYLTLTNLINPAIFVDQLDGQSVNKEALSRLFYRVEFFLENGGVGVGNQTVRDIADIKSDGYFGKSKQTISAQLKRGSFLPVFNFAVYSTYQTEKSRADNLYY